MRNNSENTTGRRLVISRAIYGTVPTVVPFLLENSFVQFSRFWTTALVKHALYKQGTWCILYSLSTVVLCLSSFSFMNRTYRKHFMCVLDLSLWSIFCLFFMVIILSKTASCFARKFRSLLMWCDDPTVYIHELNFFTILCTSFSSVVKNRCLSCCFIMSLLLDVHWLVTIVLMSTLLS